MSVNIILDHDTTFTQWDTGRYIYIEGYSQEDSVKIHYTTASSGVAFTVLPVWETNRWKAGVPNTVLTPGLPVNIYIYNEDLTENRTVYKFIVGVVQRPKPSDYIFDAYERNTLQWPYENNIEDILRSSSVIFQSEDERVIAEDQRKAAELVRDEDEIVRQSNEAVRIDNEDARQVAMRGLESQLEGVTELRQEITAARGTYNTLADRLDKYPLNGIVSNIRIENREIYVTLLDGTPPFSIGQLDNDEAIYIESISRTGGTGDHGSTDQYTILMNNGDTYEFYVYNGEDGVTFIPSVESDGTLSWSNNGGLPNPAPINLTGARGVTFTPHIDSSGNLTWTNDGGLPNPEEVNLKGESGEVAYMYTPHVSSLGVLSWTNDGGLPNPDPVNLKGTNGENGATFTPSVDENGVLSWTNDKSLPNPASRIIKGADGSDGVTFTPSVSSSGDISWTNDGGLVNPDTVNIKGPQGSQGVTFTPSVDASGNLSWSNTGGLPNPPTVNIKGAKGDPGSGGDADTLDGHLPSYFAKADHTHPDATQSSPGFMSTTDKIRLDSMTGSGTHAAQDVGTNSSPTFNIITATKVIGAVYA